MQRAWDELRGGRSNARPGRPQDRGRPIDRQEEGRKSALAQLEKVRAAREAMEKPRMDRKEDRFAAAKSEIRDYQQQQESRTHQAADAKERLAKMREQRERPRPVDRQRSRGDDRDR